MNAKVTRVLIVLPLWAMKVKPMYSFSQDQVSALNFFTRLVKN